MTSDGHSCHIYVSSFTIAKACSVAQSQLSDIFSSDRSLRKANVRFFICTFVRPIQTCRELCHHFSHQSLSSLSAVSQQSLSSLSAVSQQSLSSLSAVSQQSLSSLSAVSQSNLHQTIRMTFRFLHSG